MVRESAVAPFDLVTFDPFARAVSARVGGADRGATLPGNALFAAVVMNRVDQLARGASLRGAYGTPRRSPRAPPCCSPEPVSTNHDVSVVSIAGVLDAIRTS